MKTYKPEPRMHTDRHGWGEFIEFIEFVGFVEFVRFVEFVGRSS